MRLNDLEERPGPDQGFLGHIARRNPSLQDCERRTHAKVGFVECGEGIASTRRMRSRRRIL
jgi:hypothetical protein